MKIRIAFIQLLPGSNIETNLEIGRNACVEGHPDCNGRSTLFDGVPWIRDEQGSRDMCVFEAPGEQGVYVAELDIDSLRTHRSNDIMGDKYRHPEKYVILSDPDVRDVIGGEFVHW